ncbi:MAG: SpoIIE family protein phosphatase [Clostridia bacterium]|nr:SpoIIE family protein phosphatase [Clostridia bacterium]
MDVIKDGAVEGEIKEKRRGFFAGLIEAIKGSLAMGKEGSSIVYDAAVFVILFLFARCHVIFGAYPVAIGAIAVLPTRVWAAVLGSVLGSLTLGAPGVIYSLISVIVAFLRVIISATDRKGSDGGSPTLFSESLMLRASSALIGGFVAAVYEVLLNSLTLTTVLFAVSMIILPPVITYLLSGIFGAGIGAGAVFFGAGNLFSLRRLSEEERFSVIFFQCSSLFGIFLISISLASYELLGIGAGYLFASFAALFAARRFGALRGAAVGFAASVGLSGSYSVAFTLAGLVVGALGSLGIIPSLLLGGAALSMWGGYMDGAIGFLSVLPEYAIAAAISIPLLKRTEPEHSEEEVEASEAVAEDMVGTMALSFKNRYSGSLDTLESAFSALSRLAYDTRREDESMSREELSRLASECIKRYFAKEGAGITDAEAELEAMLSRLDTIVAVLSSGRAITREDLGAPPQLSLTAAGIAESINRAVGIVSEEKYRERKRDTSPEDYEYLSRLINEARLTDSAEKSLNEHLTAKVTELLREEGVEVCAAQVFGERRPHFIIAAEDESGSFVSSPTLRRGLEDVAGVRLGQPEYYRKGRMALVECAAARKYSASSASSVVPVSGSESGDTARAFESAEERYFALISDGMGTGGEAMKASLFVADFLGRALEFGRGCESVLRLLNNTVRKSKKECSATVDLFTLDLVSGEALFYKCGAAASYIKRGSSLFRIRSKTCPIGLCDELDAERIRVEVEGGDYIVMFSDGISQDGEAPWLLDAIAKPGVASAEALRDAIMAAARAHGRTSDDISVLVTAITML